MELISQALAEWDAGLPQVRLKADRLTLAKRRWRGMAADGREFGFELASPLGNEAVFFANESSVYRITQRAEPVLEIALIARPAPVARLGWCIGNLHFPLQVTEELVRVPDDPALRQLFEREKIPFVACEQVFEPFAKAHQHDV